MSRVVELSTGEKVTFRDRFTHADEMVYSAANNRGVVIRRYVEDGKEVLETTPENFRAAIHATLLVMIDSLKTGDEARKPTEDWLNNLLEPDYEELAEQLIAIRTESRKAVAAGKKNRG